MQISFFIYPVFIGLTIHPTEFLSFSGLRVVKNRKKEWFARSRKIFYSVEPFMRRKKEKNWHLFS